MKHLFDFMKDAPIVSLFMFFFLMQGIVAIVRAIAN